MARSGIYWLSLSFLGCLGYVAASRTQRNEERLLALNKEMEIARGIQAGLLPEKSFSVAGLLPPAAMFLPVPSRVIFMISCRKMAAWEF